MSLICEKCGSSHLQALRMVHQSGISTSRTNGNALAMDNKGRFTNVDYSGSTTNISRFAATYAPPKTNHAADHISHIKLDIFLVAGFLAAPAIFAYLMKATSNPSGLNLDMSTVRPEVVVNFFNILGWIGAGIFALHIIWLFIDLPNAQEKDREGRSVHKIWENSLLCHTCGNISLMPGYNP